MGREVQKGGDLCIVEADSRWGTAETNATCKAIILQLKIHLKKKELHVCIAETLLCAEQMSPTLWIDSRSVARSGPTLRPCGL